MQQPMMQICRPEVVHHAGTISRYELQTLTGCSEVVGGRQDCGYLPALSESWTIRFISRQLREWQQAGGSWRCCSRISKHSHRKFALFTETLVTHSAEWISTGTGGTIGVLTLNMLVGLGSRDLIPKHLDPRSCGITYAILTRDPHVS